MDNFYTDLAATRGKLKWRLDGVKIRAKEPESGLDLCPLTGVCFIKTGKVYISSSFPTAASEIGVGREDGNIIASSSDYTDGPISLWHNKNVREKILKAVGLKCCLKKTLSD